MKRKLSLQDDTAPRMDGGAKRADATPTNTSSIRSNTVSLDGQHIDIAHRDMLNFQFLGQLGHGASAMVEVVKDQTTGQKFAHKFFGKYYGKNFEGFKEAFKNEIAIIKRLQSHTHIVEVFGSYACGRELGMLLTPVANGGDLRAYLQDVKDTGTDLTENQCSVLNNSFGCLASGLAFIHRHTIRHKDIKPANILIHNDQIIFTDFGIALDAGQQNTTTTGRPGAHTPRYCAPEVANHERRNRKSDVFSLGCVYLEILAVLEPNIDLGVSKIDPYWKLVDQTRKALVDLTGTSHERCQLFRVLNRMLEPESADRIDAAALHRLLLNIQNSHPRLDYGLFCDDCIQGRKEDDAAAVNSQRIEESEPFHTKSDFLPFRDETMSSLSIPASIRKVLDRPLERNEQHSGDFFILISPGSPRFVKFEGHSSSLVRKRSMYDTWEHEEIFPKRLLSLEYARRIEQLVFAELKDIRFQKNHCEECGRKSTKWFRTTPEHIATVVKKFRDWIMREPYNMNAERNCLALSEYAREHDMEMLCQPVPFEGR